MLDKNPMIETKEETPHDATHCIPCCGGGLVEEKERNALLYLVFKGLLAHYRSILNQSKY